jgi:L-asparaginase II
MLATCVINGWSLEDYLDPQHPLQRQIRATIEEVCGEMSSNVTIDGCGAPLFYLSLDAMVRGFAHIATTAQNAPDSAEAVVYTAMSSRPELVGGTDRDVTDMMRAFPGLITKDGAEAVQVSAFADGRAFALKISDGGARGRTAATLRALELLGHTDKELTEKHWPTVLGHGEPVGEVAALF